MIAKIIRHCRRSGLYLVKLSNGDKKHLDENSLLAEVGGLTAFELYCNKGDKVFARREPKTLDKGPRLNDRIAVRFFKTWCCGKVIYCGTNEKARPVYTIEYDDGITIGPDRLNLPWQLRSSHESHETVSDKHASEDDEALAWEDAMKEAMSDRG